MGKTQKTDRRVKITKSFVDRQPYCETRQRYIYDRELSGFGLVIGKKSKSYFAEKSVNGKSCRKTFGRHGHFTPDQARKHAQQLLFEMALGKNPVKEERMAKKQAAIESKTLREVWEEFKACRELKSSTIRDYGYYINGTFGSWLDKPIKELDMEVDSLRRRLVVNYCGRA